MRNYKNFQYTFASIPFFLYIYISLLLVNINLHCFLLVLFLVHVHHTTRTDSYPLEVTNKRFSLNDSKKIYLINCEVLIHNVYFHYTMNNLGKRGVKENEKPQV